MEPEAFRWRERDIDNALMAELASRTPSEARIRALVRDGADVNSVGQVGDSVFMEAISFLQDGLDTRFVHLLVDLGADVNYWSDEAFCPLWAACLAASPALVEYLLGKGADPNVIIEFHETTLDWTECDQWYHELEAKGDVTSEDAKTAQTLAEVITVLKRHGANNLIDLRANRVSGWLHVSACYPTGALTREGYVEIDDIGGLSDYMRSEFRAWKEANRDSWPNKDWSSKPHDFDRDAHNEWGRSLSRTLRLALPSEVTVQYLSINAEDENRHVRNVDRETIVG